MKTMNFSIWLTQIGDKYYLTAFDENNEMINLEIPHKEYEKILNSYNKKVIDEVNYVLLISE